MWNLWKKYASAYHKKAKLHKEKCPAEALIASKWKPVSKSQLIKSGFMIRYEEIKDVMSIDSD